MLDPFDQLSARHQRLEKLKEAHLAKSKSNKKNRQHTEAIQRIDTMLDLLKRELGI